MDHQSLKSSAVNLGSVGADFGSRFKGSYTYLLHGVSTDSVPNRHTELPSLFFDENSQYSHRGSILLPKSFFLCIGNGKNITILLCVSLTLLYHYDER